MVIIGIALVTTVVHEMSHYMDIRKNPNATIENVCFFTLPLDGIDNFWESKIGYVEASGSNVKSSEIKAYILGFSAGTILSVILYITVLDSLQNRGGDGCL